MQQFFVENMLILRIIYVILFFLLGFTIILKINFKSELQLAKSLWLLAGYAFAQGVYEFLEIVVLVKGDEIGDTVMFDLITTELGLKALSYLFIVWLGIRLFLHTNVNTLVLKVAGGIFSFSWLALAGLTLAYRSYPAALGLYENLFRYFFAFPGFLFAGLGLLRHIREIARFGIPSLVKNLKALSLSFVAAAFIVGAVAREPVLWPATILNSQSFLEFTGGVPLIFFHSWMLFFITFFVGKIVYVFEVERDHRLQEALTRQVLLDERERIGRELHDGIIQSIYGVGLRLEQALMLSAKRPDDASQQVYNAKSELNHVIQSIRDYIQELQPNDYSCASLQEGISELIDDFRENSVLHVEMTADGEQVRDLNIVQINTLLHAIRELIINAAKHSRATVIKISLLYKPEAVRVRLSDNGIGFDPAALQPERAGEKQGLKNVFYKVGMLQGTVVFHSTPGRGAHFEITVPYQKTGFAGGVFMDNPGYFMEDAN